MEITGTKPAFVKMLLERGVYKKLDVNRSNVSNWRRALNGLDERNMPSVELMERMLQKYGASVVQEKVSDLPVDYRRG